MMLQKVKLFFSSTKQQIQSKKQLTQSSQKTPICKICFKKIEENSFHYLLTKNPTICHDCLLLFEPKLNKFLIDDIKAINIYFYNDKIKELLYQFKGCKDYELKTTFLEYYKTYLDLKFFGYVMIPAPSFADSDKERGFNHVEEIFKSLNLKMLPCIHKTKKIKQADLSQEERLNIEKILVIDDIDLTGKKILIVDDVYTTGSTIKSMIKLIKQKNPKTIKVLVMSKTIDLDQR